MIGSSEFLEEKIMMNPEQYLEATAKESMQIREQFLKECGPAVIEAARRIGKCIKNDGKLMIFGNGGSAADAQHMAAEMVGRMLIERRPLPAMALTTDSSNLTAIGNDYGFDLIFLKQVQALARPPDVMLALSTSGNSKNVILAVEAARQIGCTIIGLTGGTGGKLKNLCDIFLTASLGKNSSRIQETHLFAFHSIVDLVDRFFLEEKSKN
jgi:D-sedoheptulose 7-phosphate isomerase